MSRIRFLRREPTCPARIASGDHGAIWKCYDFQHEPVGFLVATGHECIQPIAYIGALPGLIPPGAPPRATLRYPNLDLPSLYRSALAIAADFSKAAVRPAVDLRGVAMKDKETVPDFLFYMVLKPTNGCDRAVRYWFSGANYRPFRMTPHEKMGVALFHADGAENLPMRRTQKPRPSSEPNTGLIGSKGKKALAMTAA
jgi:hypothetical protein